MSRRKVKDLASAALDRKAATEHVTACIPRHEDHFGIVRNPKRLAVHFRMLNLKRISNASGNRMRRLDNPDALLLANFTPP